LLAKIQPEVYSYQHTKFSVQILYLRTKSCHYLLLYLSIFQDLKILSKGQILSHF